MKRHGAVAGITALVLMAAIPGIVRGQAPAEERYKVRLATVPMDGGMRATVAGTGSATAILTGTKLNITGTFDGLLSPASTAAVHRGPVMAVRGPSFAPLTVTKATKGTIAGSIDLTPEQLQALKKGQLYIQISSDKAPDGNLWGWLVR